MVHFLCLFIHLPKSPFLLPLLHKSNSSPWKLTSEKMSDPQPSHSRRSILAAALRKRRTWVALFLLAYALIISSSWNILLAIQTWYNNTIAASAGVSGANGEGGSSCSNLMTSCWPAVYASVLYGAVFGLTAMAATAAVALPATLVTWITVLVLLAFAGKPQWKLVREGRNVTRDIAEIAFRILIREGNIVAAVCAVVSFFLLLWRKSPQGKDEPVVL